MFNGKKIIGTALLGCFLLSSTLPAYGATDAELEKALQNTKDILGINTAVWDEFDYSTMQQGNNSHWLLHWRNSQDDAQSLTVEIDQDGHIYTYYLDSAPAKSGLATLAKADAQKIATAYLQKVAPSVYEQMTLQEDSDRPMHNGFTFIFAQNVAGVPIKNATIAVTVDKYTGTVSSYQASDTVDFHNEIYPDKAKAIGDAAALTALEKAIGIDMMYRSYYDYNAKTTTVFPTYQLSKTNMAIDALTGEAVTLESRSAYGKGAAEAADNASPSATGRAKLTPEESRAVDQLKNILGKEDAYQRFSQALGHSIDGYTLISSELTPVFDQKDHYTWQFILEKGETKDNSPLYGSVDAQNGQILSFFCVDQKLPKLAQPKTAAEAQKEVITRLEALAPEYFKQCKLNVGTDASVTNNQYYFNYERQVNGIAFPNNGISVSYDGTTGQITDYHLNWNDSLQFPSIKEAKSVHQIAEIMVKDAHYQLMAINGTPKNQLVYTFEDSSALYYDSITGTRLNWQGKPYQADSQPIYQGLEGHPSAPAAQVLLDNGIYLNDSHINPAKVATQQELMTLLMRVMSPYATVTDTNQLYEQLIDRAIITKAEQQPEQALTRQDCAKYAVRLMHYDKLAQNSQLFVYPYSDSIEPAFKGSMAIAAGFGLLTANDQQALQPTGQVTVGDLFAFVYKLAAIQ